MGENLLEATGISRVFEKFQALAPADLVLHSGEIVVLTGANGAGKSTLLLCLSGLLRPTTGQIRLESYDLYQDERESRKRLAFVPDVPRFYQELTAWDHLRFMALAHGVEDHFDVHAEALLREFGLWDARDLFPHHYSRGMRLKLGLVMALVRPFRVLLMDEPTSALDIDSTHLLIERLSILRRDGAAILLTTHNPAIVDGLADRKLVMNQGRLGEA